MKHQLVDGYCLVPHYDDLGNKVPACQWCSNGCGWVAHDEVDGECTGKPPPLPEERRTPVGIILLCESPSGGGR